MTRLSSISILIPIMLYLLLVLLCSLPMSASSSGTDRFNIRRLIPTRVPLFGITKPKEYTPLLFFTVPKGLLPECDAMEKVVKQVEKELNVQVERMDVLRQPINESLLQLLTTKTPPFLYHRESCQSYSITPANKQAGKSKQQERSRGSIYIDKEKVRAWAKGRCLKAASYSNTISSYDKKIEAPNEVPQIDEQQQDLLEDLALTPEQRKGKQLIKERTESLKEKRVTRKQE